MLVALRERRLDGRKGAGKFRDLIECNTSVVVASKTNQGIEKASRLAVVPFGEGELILKRTGEARSVVATEHYFGGGKKTNPLIMQNGRLRLLLREKATSGTLIEWIEIGVA
jgi:hypothetical protein